MNDSCECTEPGDCGRHGVTKSLRQFELCKGINCTPQQCIKYFNAWEEGAMPGQSGPVAKPVKPRGLGDRVERVIRKTGIKSCDGCKDRAAKLNHMAPTEPDPIEPVTFAQPVRRNVQMHIWPVKNAGAWQWNCDQLMQRADMFNGRRVVAIAKSREADPPEAVKEYLSDFTDEFIVLPNSKKLREVVTFVPMLERMESLDPNEVTFCCHSKCVRHRIGIDNPGSTIFRWTNLMFETCLDYWPLVEQQLRTFGMTGSFKRYGEFRTRGNHRWHYSGTFYWFRNNDVFRRNWRYIDRRFFGSESWPGHMFRPEETGCLFADNADDLYQHDYWHGTIEPMYEEWRHEHEPLRSEQGARTPAGS